MIQDRHCFKGTHFLNASPDDDRRAEKRYGAGLDSPPRSDLIGRRKRDRHTSGKFMRGTVGAQPNAVQMIVEGDVPDATVAQLAADLRDKLARIENTQYVVRQLS
jgi:hypothetical protein